MSSVYVSIFISVSYASRYDSVDSDTAISFYYSVSGDTVLGRFGNSCLFLTLNNKSYLSS